MTYLLGAMGGALIGVALIEPPVALSHASGLYKTQAEAQHRAQALGCKGTHQIKGLWMPCSNDADLHRKLRTP